MITIGEYTIMRLSNGKIWIRHSGPDGHGMEGGEFDEKKLAQVIEKFYAKEF